MSEIERYVAYYRMPAVGDKLYADTLVCQRQSIAKFLTNPDRVLVGEFTEVLSPTHDGETSPAFELSLECCRDLDARMVCSGEPPGMGIAAQSRAECRNIDIVLVCDGVMVNDVGSQPRRKYRQSSA